jgi:hypothetical protein
MNCKPGDLAVIVRGISGWSDYCIGRIVTVTKLAANESGDPAWRYEPEIVCVKHGRPFDVIEDSMLRPLRDPGEGATDETLLWLPSPTKQGEPA